MNFTYGYSIVNREADVLPYHVRFVVASPTGETVAMATRFAYRKYAARWIALQIESLRHWEKVAAFDTDGSVFGQFWNDGDYAAECRERIASR